MTSLEGRDDVTAAGSGVGRPTSVTARQRADGGPLVVATRSRFFDYIGLDDRHDRAALRSRMRVEPAEIYNRIASAQSRVAELSLGELFMVVLGVMAVLFLIIEVVALVMGFALARSITGSIHELFMGTERVRRATSPTASACRTRDQLGELADSFNDMTGEHRGPAAAGARRRSASRRSCASRARSRCRCCRAGR